MSIDKLNTNYNKIPVKFYILKSHPTTKPIKKTPENYPASYIYCSTAFSYAFL